MKADEAGEWGGSRGGAARWKSNGKKWNLMRRWIGCGKYYQAYIAETDDGQRGLNNRIVKLEQAIKLQKPPRSAGGKLQDSRSIADFPSARVRLTPLWRGP